METNFSQGDIVLCSFDFSDFSDSKIRPCIILSKSKSKAGDYIVAKVTKNIRAKSHASFNLNNYQKDLHYRSEIDLESIQTINENIINKKIVNVSKEDLASIIKLLKKLF